MTLKSFVTVKQTCVIFVSALKLLLKDVIALCPTDAVLKKLISGSALQSYCFLSTLLVMMGLLKVQNCWKGLTLSKHTAHKWLAEATRGPCSYLALTYVLCDVITHWQHVFISFEQRLC